ncbi:MAG: glycoside hydrolase family 88 protein [Rikenellaceae bacterium]|jgi:rhamnogalacturonyl hydrolase YesR|nr:glycoside hydrolase family 88 protein [Rikenellaceae bacterium]
MKTFIAFLLGGLLLSGCGDDRYRIKQGPKPEPDVEADYDLETFPAEADPRVVGVKLAERFLEIDHSYWGNVYSTNVANHITYPDVCAWLGALWFARSVGDNGLYGRLTDRFEPLFTTKSNLQPSLTTTADNKVDYYVFGAVPLEIYRTVNDEKYKTLGLKYADGQWTAPSNASQSAKEWQNQGYSWQTRLWIDDMFMITALQAQAYLSTGDEKYIDRTAREMTLYLERLQRDNGLFYHSPSAPFYWARGTGWMAVGLAEVLRMLPAAAKYDGYRTKIMAGYLKMMDGLYRNQGAGGMWGQLIDNATIWRETSGTAMFTYAMITGVKNGWLDKKRYGAAARKAWLALQEYLNPNYDVREVCEGTGTGTTYEYYLNRRRWVGDTHGQAGMLWCAYALTTPQE